MKRYLILLAVSLSAITAYGQGYGGRQTPPQGPPPKQAPAPNKPNGQYHGQPHGQQHVANQHPHILPDGPGRSSRQLVYCTEDWQELWNGRHVRIKGGKVRICKRNDDVLLKGDEVILIYSGNYLVRNGSDWRVYDEDGDRTFIHGREILVWPDEYYCVRQTDDRWRVYDRNGDSVFNVWGEEIELMHNGLFRCVKNGRVYFYDKDGNQRH